jgi:uncharacterized protein
MNSDDHKNQVIASPCIRKCCLNPQDICVGCFRTLDEILAWSASNNFEKHNILQDCEQRKIAAQKS